jgi:hypothetical protein
MEQDIMNQKPSMVEIKRKVIVLNLFQVAKLKGLESAVKLAKEKFSLKIRKDAKEIYEKARNRNYLIE